MKLFKNKKGFTADFVILLICVIIFCVASFFFFLLFHFLGKAATYDIKGSMESTYAAPQLVNYLRLPTEINNQKTNIADLIGLYYTEQDEAKKKEYRNKLEPITIDFLNSQEYCYKSEYGAKLTRGFMIFLTDNPSEYSKNPSMYRDRKFKSKNTIENIQELIVPQLIPLQNGKVMYVLWVETSAQVGC